MERGDTGLGRDAYAPPRRVRMGDRLAYGPGDDPEEADAGGASGLEAADGSYGQLLRRPGEVPPHTQRLRAPDPQRARQPDRFPPPGGHPAPGHPAPGLPPTDIPRNGAPAHGGPDGQSRLPNGRRIPRDADRLYRGPGPAEGTRGRPGPAQGPGQDPLGDMRARPPQPPQAPGAPPPRVPGYGGVSGIPPLRENRGAARSPGPAGSRPYAPEGWEHLGAQGGGRGAPVSAEPAGPPGQAGPVIRQRETAVPDERPITAAQSVASIAPDDLESFARDLRALRARAELDYPQMAEVSHFTMKTLASAAGGLRLPTLPVAVAYVRACGGDLADWEERWQKLAAKITADAAKKRRAEDPPEPTDPPAVGEPPALAATAQDQDLDPGEVYVITSARPRPPGW